jgi:2'-phosphotransferase
MSSTHDKQQLIRASKYLSFLLRHGAIENNLKISPDGFIKVQEILNLKQSSSYRLNLELIRQIVDTNDKKRFELKQADNDWLIRASQGEC